MNPTMLTMLTPAETGKSLAERAKTLRLLRGWTRDTFARRAGVSPATLKRFETTGKASLDLVLRVAHALSRLEEFNELLQPPPAGSIEQLERRSAAPAQKRGRV